MYICADCVKPEQRQGATPIDCGRHRWLKCKVCGRRRRMGWIIPEKREET